MQNSICSVSDYERCSIHYVVITQQNSADQTVLVEDEFLNITTVLHFVLFILVHILHFPRNYAFLLFYILWSYMLVHYYVVMCEL